MFFLFLESVLHKDDEGDLDREAMVHMPHKRTHEPLLESDIRHRFKQLSWDNGDG